MRGKLSILDQVEVASPCSESWERMTGDERVRHCAKCDLDVFNLSEMTRADAEALLRARWGVGKRLCVRLYKRADGTVITQDCPVGLARIRRRIARISAIAAGLLFAALGVDLLHARRSGAAELEASTPGSRVKQWVSNSWLAPSPTPVPQPYTQVAGGISAPPPGWNVNTPPTHPKKKTKVCIHPAPSPTATP